MDCNNCHQPVEPGAAFCGSCGHAVTSAAQLSSMSGANTTVSAALDAARQVNAAELTSMGAPLVTAAIGGVNLPAYAVPVQSQQRDHMKAAIAVVCGLLSLVGSLFMPFIGIVLAVVGIILGTMSRRYLKHGIGLAGLILSSLGLVAGIASWVYVVSHDPQAAQKASAAATSNSSAVAADAVSTPCYDVQFPSRLQVQNPTGSCNMNAFDGQTMDNSTTAYKIFATASAVSPTAFPNIAKNALEHDMQQSAPDFHISREAAGSFSGSPAYIITSTNSKGVTLIEAAVLHSGSGDNNLYVLVHAATGTNVNLQAIEKGWQWK